MKFPKIVAAGLFVLSANSQASMVNLTALSNVDALNIGDSFSLKVTGSEFESDIAISGGAFKIQFNDTIIRLDTVAINKTVWNFLDGKNSFGDYTFNTSAFGSEPRGSFEIGTLNFTAIGNGSTAIALQAPTADWGSPDTRFPTGVYPKNQIQFNSLGPVSVGNVPVPASVWLFGSGIISVLGLFRKKAA